MDPDENPRWVQQQQHDLLVAVDMVDNDSQDTVTDMAWASIYWSNAHAFALDLTGVYLPNGYENKIILLIATN